MNASTQTQPPSPVVVATDGSEVADAAVDWAAQEAVGRSTSLVILTAYAPLITPVGPAGVDTSMLQRPWVLEAAREQHRVGTEVVSRAADRVRSKFVDLVVETKVYEGDPRQALEAGEGNAAVVVLGSRGLGALRTMWLGSVSYWATRHLHVPTVVVRPLASDRPSAVRGIAVGVDIGDASEATLRAAFEMAQHGHCSLTIANAWWEPDGPIAHWRWVEAKSVEPARLQAVDKLVARIAADYADVTFDVVFGCGRVVDFLLDLARSHAALVVGRHRTSPLDITGLGTVARAIVEHAVGVIVIVPTGSVLS